MPIVDVIVAVVVGKLGAVEDGGVDSRRRFWVMDWLERDAALRSIFRSLSKAWRLLRW